jgi:MFS family permease
VISVTIPNRLSKVIPERKFAGLTANLWRLALVIGVGQFSISVWSWQFGIFIETLIEPWQMGLTFTASSIAGIIGVPLSGYVSDFIGRRKTLLIAYIPMAVGLFLLFAYPVWPFLPFFYGLAQFGWSFVVIMARAAPADQISKDNGKDAAKTFSMVLLPAFAVDGLSPLLASLLLMAGFAQQNLLLLGGIGTILAFIASYIFVRETLSDSIQEKARKGSILAIRGLGHDFWILAVGIIGVAFSFGMSSSYLGNLVTLEWGIDTATWGIIWSISSICVAAFSYYGGELADKNLKPALWLGILSNIFVLGTFAYGSGIEVLVILNILWAFPIVIWLSSERVLVVQGVSEEMKGRAFGTYQVVISLVQIFAMNMGAWIWAAFGCLRLVFAVATGIMLVNLVPLAIALYFIKIKIDNQELVDSSD